MTEQIKHNSNQVYGIKKNNTDTKFFLFNSNNHLGNN